MIRHINGRHIEREAAAKTWQRWVSLASVWHPAALWSLIVACAILAVRPLAACDIPVYKYALDLWPADQYEAIVIHRGEAAALTMLEAWRKLAVNDINLVVRDAPPEQSDGPLGEWLLDHPVTQTPWLALRFPVRLDTRQTLWSGPLDTHQAQLWIDSPMRQRIAQHLQAESPGVWLFLGNSPRDKESAAFTLLHNELNRLERVLRLRDANAIEDAAAQQKPVFARLFLDRNDTEEAALVAMLLHSEPGLADMTNLPMVFPIYGRGIILYALAGAGINIANITAAAEFLVGDCACEVKSENPGLELLLKAPWSEQPAGSFADFDTRGERAAVQLEDIRGVIPSATLHSEAVVATTPATAGASSVPFQPEAIRKPRWPWIVGITIITMGGVYLISIGKGGRNQ